MAWLKRLSLKVLLDPRAAPGFPCFPVHLGGKPFSLFFSGQENSSFTSVIIHNRSTAMIISPGKAANGKAVTKQPGPEVTPWWIETSLFGEGRGNSFKAWVALLSSMHISLDHLEEQREEAVLSWLIPGASQPYFPGQH